jgi:hypothetical protein
MEKWFENICACCSLDSAGFTLSTFASVYGISLMSYSIYEALEDDKNLKGII